MTIKILWKIPVENSHNESDAKPDIFNRRPKLHDVYCSPGVHRAPILKVRSDSEFVVIPNDLLELKSSTCHLWRNGSE